MEQLLATIDTVALCYGISAEAKSIIISICQDTIAQNASLLDMIIRSGTMEAFVVRTAMNALADTHSRLGAFDNADSGGTEDSDGVLCGGSGAREKAYERQKRPVISY